MADNGSGYHEYRNGNLYVKAVSRGYRKWNSLTGLRSNKAMASDVITRDDSASTCNAAFVAISSLLKTVCVEATMFPGLSCQDPKASYTIHMQLSNSVSQRNLCQIGFKIQLGAMEKWYLSCDVWCGLCHRIHFFDFHFFWHDWLYKWRHVPKRRSI